jgi:hypothetical protein
LTNRRWISDITGTLSVGVLVDYLHLWNLISDFELLPDVEDKHIFSIAANGAYLAKTAYEGLFTGPVHFSHYERVWKTWAPSKCHFFLWLTTLNRCWIVDRLAKRGLDHPERCPLYDQDSETLDHIMVYCVFAREFWFLLMHQFRLHSLASIPGTESFMGWWEKIDKSFGDMAMGGGGVSILLLPWVPGFFGITGIELSLMDYLLVSSQLSVWQGRNTSCGKWRELRVFFLAATTHVS